MKERVQLWSERIDALSLRERALLLVAAVAVLFGIVNTLLLAPLARTQHERTQQIQRIQSQIATQGQQARNLSLQGRNTDADPRQRELTRLHEQLAAVDKRLRRRLGTLIRPSQAPAVLKTLLRREQGLRLISLEARRAPPLPASGNLSGSQPDSLGDAGIARYTFTLHFKGSYLSTLDYLQALEKLPWQLFWQRIDLQADRHADTRVTLEVYTLGQADAEHFQ
ncbi:MAG: hypothetical protein P8180_09380 [Gammaproteobacteria bacterium]